MKRNILLAALFAFSLPAILGAQGFSRHFNPQLYTGYFWVRNYEVTSEGFSPQEDSVTPGERAQIQAETAFAAMIYGYRFVFVPNSRLNRVGRSLELELKGAVDPNQIQTEILESNNEQTEYLCRYRPRPDERRRRELWQSTRFQSTFGRGEASLFEGFKARELAVEDAIRNALINLFKESLANKPRAVEGNLIWVEPPRIFLNKGLLVAEVKLRVEELQVDRYLMP